MSAMWRIYVNILCIAFDMQMLLTNNPMFIDLMRLIKSQVVVVMIMMLIFMTVVVVVVMTMMMLRLG